MFSFGLWLYSLQLELSAIKFPYYTVILLVQSSLRKYVGVTLACSFLIPEMKVARK